MFHLGGRYFLALKEQTIPLSNGPLRMSPLAIYHIPCNSTSDKLPTGFGTCPSVLTINLPIFRRKIIKFVPWTPNHYNATIDLHYKSLSIPPPLTVNKTVITALDKTFNRLNGHLATKLNKVQQDIKNIHEVTTTPIALVLGSIALCISIINFIIIVVIYYCHRAYQRHNPDLNLVHYVQTNPTQAQNRTEGPELIPMNDICPDCGEPQQSNSTY
ncbi:hypothetical protein QZH41_006947 [Actinostola sp. cb2023]|nr:hypothetical protein QZH41_006947 [Actinostola sp. cb2023]